MRKGEVVSFYQAICQERSLVTSIFGHEPEIIVIDQPTAPDEVLREPKYSLIDAALVEILRICTYSTVTFPDALPGTETGRR